MTSWTVLPGPVVRDLAGWLASWSWPLDEAGSIALAQQRGWTLRMGELGLGGMWDTHLGGSRSWASVTVVEGQVSRVRLVASDSFAEPTEQSEAYVMDELARQVGLVREVLGPAGEVGMNDMPGVRWRLGGGATLLLGGGRCCFWTLSSPRFAEVGDRLEAGRSA